MDNNIILNGLHLNSLDSLYHSINLSSQDELIGLINKGKRKDYYIGNILLI